jgi:hypothetical protein
MSTSQNETTLNIKSVGQRWIGIEENILEALTIHSYVVYSALRFLADYGKDDAILKLTSKTVYTKAKISRAQYFKCINELEQNGLVLRDSRALIGGNAIIHVAKHLNYFTPQICSELLNNETPVSDVDGSVHHVDTLISNSFKNKDNTISEFDNSPVTARIQKPQKPKPKKQSPVELRELIEVYRQTFPDNPQPHKTLISTSLQRTLSSLVQHWPRIDPNGNPITVAAFRNYLSMLKSNAPKFSLGEYLTPDGNKKKNNLETFARFNTVVKFLENAYS